MVTKYDGFLLVLQFGRYLRIFLSATIVLLIYNTPIETSQTCVDKVVGYD